MTERKRFGAGRVARARKLGGLAAGHAARSAGSRVAGAGRSEEAKREARRRQQLATADRLVDVLGSMKGAAMKLGQTLSVIDIGLVDPEFREEFQAKLGALQNMAPPARFKDMRGVIEADLGRPLSEVFARFDEEPVAAASIGQVYRAMLVDGREVAVKVQYPGVEQMIRADLKNLDIALKLLSRFTVAGISVDDVASEVQERFTEELDYELEATNQKAMARAYRGHPFVVVPDVMTDLCGPRVIVSEFVDGKRFADLLACDAATRRDRAEILFRFYINGPLRHRLLNGDPHPGNALFLDDGRVAFLDFGFFQRLTKPETDEIIEVLAAAGERDDDRLLRVTVQAGLLSDQAEDVGPFAELVQSTCGWFLTDGEVRIRPGQTAEVVEQLGELQRSGGLRGGLAIPAHHAVLLRAFALVFGILGQLDVELNWHRMYREIVYGDPPVTERGRQEADHLAQRAGSTPHA
ncbi:MAG: ABC1 kinase family protein [Solirubrobacteraceae bacterium]